MTARRIRTPLFLALGLVALTACKTQTIEIRPPDPVVAVPRPEDPGVVTLASALPQRLIAADKATEVRVRLRIDASKLAHSKRPPINVVLVMDSSGSMEGKAIEDARAAAVRGYLNDGVNRLVLLSEGVPNDESPMTALAQQAASMHVSVTALGLEYNKTPAEQHRADHRRQVPLRRGLDAGRHRVSRGGLAARAGRRPQRAAHAARRPRRHGRGRTRPQHDTGRQPPHHVFAARRPRRAPSPRRASPPSCWATANSSSWPTASSSSAKPSRPSCCNPSRSPSPAPAFRRARSQRPR